MDPLGLAQALPANIRHEGKGLIVKHTSLLITAIKSFLVWLRQGGAPLG
jgi:hypothetical protein